MVFHRLEEANDEARQFGARQLNACTYIYFPDNETYDNALSMEKFLTHLLLQLIRCIHRFKAPVPHDSLLERFTRLKSDQAALTEKELRQLLCDTSQCFATIYLTVDAFNNCPDGCGDSNIASQQDVARFIQELPENWKILFTSRSDMLNEFVADGGREIHVVATHNDIELYVKGRISENRRFANLVAAARSARCNDWMVNEIVNTINDRAHGT